ncbi:nucleoside 2-deoxyribosyltransferase domain-containing protein [Kerstersia gyiorum]|uniref:nucleoside 2-deoxyribosyltransferase domain-containing protein n=1 Tax=Kerstersia gyiorum TaxID=206506 RepID=UPI0020A065BE|nr:nucleoside 2-deoxyribosyltransferase domain-containing protein [Kerstersia gyiorum]MCP1634820.1 nucleoside 2-deoxyribosyltransferase [Kerstersia gyiorum]MCP1638144.1 nucleoside 2-deoxyribosyltransferase [Kerstersia gyiorum]MCP1672734.1 nucleoside 2-deoxyribosyltransferase [Kerstersia gyiorum]MCP1683915.1 nucleoside 2-deoxyribosyltransferase [Kerstersia gyiorum]MCP1710599.1 nucleoside 2-deoxyribosyltransferase [Kerstersia gyiorum]
MLEEPPLPLRKIYLAGGFRSNWQALVVARLAGSFELLDPSAHNIQDPVEYTQWDLEAIRQSDIVLANMEASNPGGYSLALEVGFAKALGKQIFMVDQVKDPSVHRYLEMVRQCSERVFPTLGEAIDHLLSID